MEAPGLHALGRKGSAFPFKIKFPPLRFQEFRSYAAVGSTTRRLHKLTNIAGAKLFYKPTKQPFGRPINTRPLMPRKYAEQLACRCSDSFVLDGGEEPWMRPQKSMIYQGSVIACSNEV